LGQIIPLGGWCPGNLDQNDLKPTPLMMSPTKNRSPKLLNFFENANQNTHSTFWGVEQLSSPIGWWVNWVAKRHKNSGSCGISKYEYIVPRLPRC